MNIVISGPFGLGSLADEAVLAGLLKHVSGEKNSVTIITHDTDKSRLIHAVPSVVLQSPNSFISNSGVWRLLEKAHLFVLASAGPLSAHGKQPARNWLAQLEHAQRAGAKTAIVGVGALKISDARERARAQRFLQLNTDAISTRDSQSKDAVISYGMNSNRVSHNGDPTLALAESEPAASAGTTIGIVLAENVPSRGQFGFEPAEFRNAAAGTAKSLVELLLKNSDKSLKVFHDDVDAARDIGESIRSISSERISTHTCNEPIANTLQALKRCASIFSFSLHGLLLGAAVGVPVVGLNEEIGAAEFLESLGLREYILPAPGGRLNVDTTADALRAQILRGSELRELLHNRLAILKKKEAQNARMMMLLVPRRVAYERDKSSIESPLPKKKHKPHVSARKR